MSLESRWLRSVIVRPFWGTLTLVREAGWKLCLLAEGRSMLRPYTCASASSQALAVVVTRRMKPVSCSK